ncbi:MAG: LPS export ABC transporter periplasmic protein LptC [Paracoccaceae bacterium]|nr:LPS export ABC transporter periplasmic protein LptC [Paracoccaceae bacterium]
MGRAEGLYSQTIAWLKIVLPIVALGLLSTLFLLSRDREPLEDVPFAVALSEGQTASEQVGSPYYAGTTDNGEVLSLTAGSARPLGDEVEADNVEARIVLTDGSQIGMTSNAALLSNPDQTVRLDGAVRIESSTGYVMETQSLTAALDRVEAESAGPVSARGPAGTLTAGKMRITPIGETDDVQILFTEGVNLIYDPKQSER